MRPIVVDVTEGESVIISSGLSVGEQVVLDGQNQLRPGSRVSVTAPAPKDAKPKKDAPAGSSGPATGSTAAPAPPASGTKQ